MSFFRPLLPMFFVCLAILFCAAGCSVGTTVSNGGLVLTSPAFSDGAGIPAVYSCDGQNTSPALNWNGVPSGTKSFALIVHDSDAPLTGGFTHWVVFNIPPSASGFEANVPKQATLNNGAMQGNNGAGNPGYTGPCPPAGAPHHYQFRLYALDRTLSLSGGATKAQVEAAMNGHILAQALLTGLYQRA